MGLLSEPKKRGYPIEKSFGKTTQERPSQVLMWIFSEMANYRHLSIERSELAAAIFEKDR